MRKQDTRIRILYVDDEANNLLAFQAGFRRFYEIYTATSVAEGLAILNDHEIHVILADQRMPKVTGVEFFSIVRKAHPDPMRILITGYTDLGALVEAINSGEIFRYIKKPWDDLELKTAIQNAYEVYGTRLELKNKIRELERTNDELNRFVYSTSHDLRSPLANILGILNVAKLQSPSEDPTGFYDMIESCVNKMDLFIHKIIEYYKGIRVDNVNEVVDFHTLVNDSISLCNMQNPQLVFETKVDQTAEFHSDSFRLSLVLNNLISNAVKYQRSDEERPKVSITVKADKKEALIFIEDNGVGIIEDHLNKIFQIFFRSTDYRNGLGIGLYIVKEALTRIGGDINVNSEFGKGTRFTLKVPNHNEQEEPEVAETAA
ncbi:hybrid sensor histidine kinase/response regulator [Sediminibacterium sp. WSJ-3]|nr:hybrid sensor histidine kinase/response regulator [Sediminibacterium soli]